MNWFRSYLKKSVIEVQQIGTKDQRADIFTKLLARDGFIALKNDHGLVSLDLCFPVYLLHIILGKLSAAQEVEK